MINYIYIILPIHIWMSRSNPLYYNIRVRPKQLPTHRADFCLNITDINYILDSHLNEIYLTLGWCSICLSTILSLSEIIPLFLRPIIYNTKKYLTKKYYKYSFIYYKEFINKQNERNKNE